MSTYIALFRGINVGGKNAVPMTELADLLRGLAFRNVRTYIQSGNVVFDRGAGGRRAIATEIQNSVEQRFGFRPHVVVLEQRMMQRVVKENPFPEAGAKPQSLHVFFLASTPRRPDLESLDGIKARNERFGLKETVFYLHAPDGIGRSRLAARVEKLLGVAATARNWRTVLKLLEMAAPARRL